MGAQVLLKSEQRSPEPAAPAGGWDAYAVWRERIQNAFDPNATQVIASSGWDPYAVWKNRVLKDDR